MHLQFTCMHVCIYGNYFWVRFLCVCTWDVEAHHVHAYRHACRRVHACMLIRIWAQENFCM